MRIGVAHVELGVGEIDPHEPRDVALDAAEVEVLREQALEGPFSVVEERMTPASPEYQMIRTYFEMLIEEEMPGAEGVERVSPTNMGVLSWRMKRFWGSSGGHSCAFHCSYWFIPSSMPISSPP